MALALLLLGADPEGMGAKGPPDQFLDSPPGRNFIRLHTPEISS